MIRHIKGLDEAALTLLTRRLQRELSRSPNIPIALDRVRHAWAAAMGYADWPQLIDSRRAREQKMDAPVSLQTLRWRERVLNAYGQRDWNGWTAERWTAVWTQDVFPDDPPNPEGFRPHVWTQAVWNGPEATEHFFAREGEAGNGLPAAAARTLLRIARALPRRSETERRWAKAVAYFWACTSDGCTTQRTPLMHFWFLAVPAARWPQWKRRLPICPDRVHWNEVFGPPRWSSRLAWECMQTPDLRAMADGAAIDAVASGISKTQKRNG